MVKQLQGYSSGLDRNWVDLDLGSSLKQSGGTSQIKVNPTLCPDLMNNPVHHFQLNCVPGAGEEVVVEDELLPVGPDAVAAGELGPRAKVTLVLQGRPDVMEEGRYETVQILHHSCVFLNGCVE